MTPPRWGERGRDERGTNVTAKSRTRMTRDNTAVLLIDHQVGLFTGIRDYDTVMVENMADNADPKANDV
jgi:hypothetical protein